MQRTTTEGYIVIIEWDGKIPPTPYYHRLRNMTSGVRGDKDVNVIERRASNISDDQMSGLILQEGAIVTPSYSLASTIAAVAKSYGAPMVHIGEVSLQNYVEMSDGDRAAMARVSEAYGKRGRPQKPINWMVSCMEEMRSYFVRDKPFVAACPTCGGFAIATAPAKSPIRYEYRVEKGSEYSLINEWQVTRFGSGVFMPPLPKDYVYQYMPESPHAHGYVDLPAKTIRKGIKTVSINNDQQAQVLEKILASKTLLDKMFAAYESDNDIKDDIFNMLDGILVGQIYFTEKQRDKGRVRSIMEIMSDGNKRYIPMSSNDSDFDVLDASCVFAPDYMKGVFYILGGV